MTTLAEIADIADRHRGLVLALNATWGLILHPALPLTQIFAPFIVGGDAGEDVPFLVGDEPGDPNPIELSSHQIYREAAEAARRMPTVRIQVLSIAMDAAVTHLGDEIKKSGLHRYDDPLLEFLRHFRNAAAHGGKWSFDKKEPTNEASFGGLTLTKDMDGQSTLYTFGPKSGVLLLEAIRDHFREMGQADGGQTS